jgi:predicted phosphohydrolase
MKIQYCSDLHLEFPQNRNYLMQNPLKPLGEILLLAGDILPFRLRSEPCEFLDFAADNFETTYWIPGNHEYYHYDMGKYYSAILENVRSNVVLVNNHSISHKQLKLVCGTLWSTIQEQSEWVVSQSVNDFHLIKKNGEKLTTKQFNFMHQVDLNALKAGIFYSTSENKVVLTHYVPTRYEYPNQYKNSNINDAFAVELYDLIFQSNIPYWIYGHHHVNTPPFKIGRTTLLTNQLGYVASGEHHSFKHDAVIEI